MFEHAETVVIVFAVIAALCLTVGIFIGSRMRSPERQKESEELQTWRMWYLRKDCVYRSARGQIGYCTLRSLDGGQTWYAVEIDEYFHSVKVIGLAQYVYPGILEQAGLIELTDFCFLHGGPTLEGKEQSSYQELLRRAQVQALARP